MDTIRNRDSPFQWNPRAGIPTFQIHTRPLKRPKRANTTRDQRRDCKMAYRCGLNDYQIAEKVGIDVRQVRYPLDNEAPTPKKKAWPSSLRCRAKAAISRLCLQFQEDALDDI
jgi:hypothetical protein